MRTEKEAAIALRKDGKTYPEIEQMLGINRSTLSCWLSNLAISPAAQQRILKRKQQNLIRAQKLASAWHRNAKTQCTRKIKKRASDLVQDYLVNVQSISIALSMLYLGEGFKASQELGLGSSSPQILLFFLASIESLFGLKRDKLRYELHLRADQNPEELKSYWSKELGVPLENFKYYHLDKRTIGRKTHSEYRGVCSARGGPVEIQRFLIYTSKLFCQKVINLRV